MNLALRCPSCGDYGKVEIPEHLIEDAKKGLITVNIPAQLMCPHTFQVFIDKNAMIRGYQANDYTLEIPVESPKTVRVKEETISLHTILSLTTSDIFLRLIKNLLLGNPVTIICEHEQLTQQFTQQFTFLD